MGIPINAIGGEGGKSQIGQRKQDHEYRYRKQADLVKNRYLRP
jgi:hypothetical protein